MIGVTEFSTSVATKRLHEETEAVRALRSLGRTTRRILKEYGLTDVKGYGRDDCRAKRIRALRRCESLATMFREVQRDESVKRKVKIDSRLSLEAPLIFHASIPASRITTIEFYIERQHYSAKALTPMPTIEALDAIRQHQHLFDDVEVWWVPNDILIEKVPDPDPIVVGVIRVGDDRFYYELHRWVDEDHELSWWSKEAY